MNWLYLPPWGVRAVTGVAVLLFLLLVLQSWRERRGGSRKRRVGPLVLRGLLLAGLVIILLNPVALRPREQAGRPKLVLLVDTSASMATRDVEGQSRLTAAARVLAEPATRERLEREFTLDLRRFDKQSQPFDWRDLAAMPADGDGSDLGGAIASAVNDLAQAKSAAGVVVVSDGRATTEGAVEAARLALAQSVPLWTYCVGGNVVRHDLWIEVAAPEVLAFAGAEVDLAATLHQTGYANRGFRVDVLQEGRVLETREVVPDAQGVAPVTTRVKAPPGGEHRYTFRVAPDPLEADPRNNERSVYVRVVGEKVRVLVAEGQPHWDTKFLVQALKRSPHVDLTAVYRLGPHRDFAVVSAEGQEQRVERDLFPRTAAEFNQYDVVVLGRGCEVFFGPDTEASLTEFVARRGGSLVFSRGKAYGGRFPPLAQLEPIVWSQGSAVQVRPRLTAAGQETPIFELGGTGGLEDWLAKLPALDEAAVTAGEKPLAVVLATAEHAGPSGPSERTVLLAYQRFGQGKVVALNAAGLWRWAFGDAEHPELETAYPGFWLSLLRWLLAGTDFLPGTDVALRSARRAYTSEQPMQFLVTTKGVAPDVYQPRVVIRGEGRTVEVEPRLSGTGGGYVAEAGPFPPGTYAVILQNNIGAPASITQSVEVVSASVESRVLSADPAMMRRLAEISGGTTLTAHDLAHFDDVLRHWRAARQLSDQRITLWDRGWVLALMIGLLGAEWWWRRQEGLV